MELFVNEAVFPLTATVKLAVGLGAMITCFVIEAGPPLPDTVRVTLKVPALPQSTFGFCCVELAGVPPWNVQLRPVILPVDISVNWMVWLWQAGLGDQLKFGTGGALPPQDDRQPSLIRKLILLLILLRDKVLQVLVVETKGHIMKFGGQLLPVSGS